MRFTDEDVTHIFEHAGMSYLCLVFLILRSQFDDILYSTIRETMLYHRSRLSKLNNPKMHTMMRFEEENHQVKHMYLWY